MFYAPCQRGKEKPGEKIVTAKYEDLEHCRFRFDFFFFHFGLRAVLSMVNTETDCRCDKFRGGGWGAENIPG